MRIDNQTVLVVDDDPSVARLVADFLADAGYHVLIANGGLEGLAIVRSAAPSLIICDACMPHLSGPDLIAALKADPGTAGIPVVLMSGYHDSEFEHVPAAGFLPKPFQMSEVVQIADRLLAHPAAVDLAAASGCAATECCSPPRART